MSMTELAGMEEHALRVRCFCQEHIIRKQERQISRWKTKTKVARDGDELKKELSKNKKGFTKLLKEHKLLKKRVVDTFGRDILNQLKDKEIPIEDIRELYAPSKVILKKMVSR